MGYKRILMLVAVFLMLYSFDVKADDTCSYKDQASLNEIAAMVKANFEIKETTEPIEYEDPDGLGMITGTKTIPSFDIKIYNITEDLSLSITDSLEHKVVNVSYADTDKGVYTFHSDNYSDIITYTIVINSNLKSCPGLKVKTLTFIKPKLNPYAFYAMCDGHESVSYCKEYVTKDFEVSDDELAKAIEAFDNSTDNKNNDKEETNVFLKFLKNNYIYIIIGTFLIGGGITAGVIIYKKRSKL